VCCTTLTVERRGEARDCHGDERRYSKEQGWRLQVNAVQWAGEVQTYMMRMAMRGALGISPNDDTDCHHGVERTGYAATNFK
jgi:hypothetical protein